MADYIERRVRIKNKIQNLTDDRSIFGFSLRLFFDEWFNETSLSLVTFESRIDEMNRFVRWCSGRKITKPTREHAKSYFSELDERGLKKTSIKTAHSSLHPIFIRMNAFELYPDIFACIELVKFESNEKEILMMHEAKHLIEHTFDPRTKVIVMLMIMCGLRCVEVSELLWRDIHEDRAVIRGKARAEKKISIVLPPSVFEALNAWRDVTKGSKNDNAPVFVSRHRNKDGALPPLSPVAISIAIGKHIRNMFPEKNNLSAHSLRHTSITLAIESGMDVTRVSRFARHRSINTTMIYIHDKERYSDPAEARIESMINHACDSKTPDEYIENSLKRALMKLLKNSQSIKD